MFTRIDHVMICVPDLAQAIEQYRRLGFSIHPAGAHTGKGTHNAIALNEHDYLELLAIHDHAEYRAAASNNLGWGPALPDFIAAGGGIRYIVIQSDDLKADVDAMRTRGVEVSGPIDGERRTPAGDTLRWKIAVLGARDALPLFFIEHLAPLEQRHGQVPGYRAHPNGVYALERAYIVTSDAQAAAAQYAKVLGVEVPPLQRGTVIMSHMAVFQIGGTGLGIAQPYAPGPAADSLERRGPGPFQALYRTASMGAAARWISEQGVPPLTRGVRNTGEHAMLATPNVACGAYIGFVGPE
jgi:catechol 2,3-dioxygenase-like lactoylglutathione lyase family enzyme